MNVKEGPEASSLALICISWWYCECLWNIPCVTLYPWADYVTPAVLGIDSGGRTCRLDVSTIKLT